MHSRGEYELYIRRRRGPGKVGWRGVAGGGRDGHLIHTQPIQTWGTPGKCSREIPANLQLPQMGTYGEREGEVRRRCAQLAPCQRGLSRMPSSWNGMRGRTPIPGVVCIPGAVCMIPVWISGLGLRYLRVSFGVDSGGQRTEH